MMGSQLRFCAFSHMEVCILYLDISSHFTIGLTNPIIDIISVMQMHLVFRFHQSKLNMILDVRDSRSSDCDCLHPDGIASSSWL